MTFSLTARCADTGMFGIVVTSSSICVATRCAWVRGRVGAVASQNITDPKLGGLTLDMMITGADAKQALGAVVTASPNIEYRQLIAIDAKGVTAGFSGQHTLGTHAMAEGRDVVAAGNLLDNEGVPSALVEAFEGASGHLGDRLVAAMQAGLAAGGEAGPLHSAGLMIVDDVDWAVADLRVDWSEGDPIEELAQLWRLYKPQLEDYVTRALDPTKAPSYGVPGDE
jgi:uncharacterized Ntn-hydrolase superfamily protein